MSLLSKALAGGGSAAPAKAKADASSFPCISEGEPMPDGLDFAFDKLDLKNRTVLPGSAPTMQKLAGSYTADYELNPYRLRGGEEYVSSASLKDHAANFLTDAVIRSLPKALTTEEKARAIAASPLSPTMNLLSTLPMDRVAGRSMEGRKLRRHVLRGAVIVFITAGYSGKRFIFERAKELGVRSVIIDGPDSWSRELVGEGVVERVIPVDLSDTDTVFDKCLEAIQKTRRDLGDLDGIACFSELAVPLASRLQERLGLPGNSPASVDAARDKHQTRTALAAAGLPTPKNMLVSNESELKAASDHVGYPAVIKPIFGAASLGVVRVDSWEGLQKAYTKVCAELAATVVEGGVVKSVDESVAKEDRKGPSLEAMILMEEYLDGPEVDVDLVMSQGNAVYGAVTDNWPTVEPYFNETGSNAPSILPASQQRELIEVAVNSVQALGLTTGVFHVEGKYTTRGPRLIEVNCRMGGGPVCSMNKLVWGVDLVEEQLLSACGIPSRPPVAAKPIKPIAEFSVNAMKSGIVRDFSFLDRYKTDPDVIYARPLVDPGTKVTCVEDGLPTWLCELMVTRPDIHDAIAKVKQMETEIQAAMVIDPLPAK